jgi:tRNA G18 (ribose-2'-O)-methylase SpoU
LKFQPEPVEDPDDPRIADFVALNDPQRRRAVERDGDFFVAEGALVIRHLLRSRYPVRAVLATAQGLAALDDVLGGVQAPVYATTQALMTSIAGFRFHRGALASAGRLPQPDLDTVIHGAGLVLMVEGVTDNENLGALFRNAAAFDVAGVVLDATSADPLYRRSVRVSMGHVLRLPYTRVPDATGTIGTLQGLGFEVVALTPDRGADDIRRVFPGGRHTLRPGGRRVLLVGAEGPGLSDRALAAADRRVRIAMAAGVDSLNVATAAAVALHHLIGVR